MTGVYTSESTEGDKSLFVVERQAWYDLCSGLSQRCPCSLVASTWVVDLESVKQVSSRMYIVCRSDIIVALISMGMY